MRLTNHIALRFLTDDSLIYEIMEVTNPGIIKKIQDTPDAITDDENAKVQGFWKLMNKEDQRAYLVTDSVHDRLDMLKIKRDENNHYDWTVFNKILPCKKTFILQPTPEWKGGGCLRLLVDRDNLGFCHVGFNFKPGSKDYGNILWTMFYINRYNNEHAEHCESQNVKDIYEFVYKLLCFIFLSENDYEVVNPGASRGTQKKGKFKNDLPIPVTIINSKWNITVIRTDDFAVSGHFALRRCGPGRVDTRMVYIEPYLKHGYIRRAQNETEK